MECIFCTSLITNVIESRRLVRNRERIYHRRRECPECGRRFSTKEIVYHRKQSREAARRRTPKGRNAGVKHGMCVLEEENIYQIRELFDNDVPRKAIADMFGISLSHVGDIGRRRRWKHLPDKDCNGHA